MNRFMTRFQKTLPKDIDTLLGVIKIFHPDIPNTFTYHTKNKGEIVKDIKDIISVGVKYDWVTIYFKAKDYGTVSIGIKNCFHSFSGEGITKNQMEKALKSGKCTIGAWRFSDDSKANEYNPSSEEHKRLSKETADYLLSRGYSLQTPNEMYDNYYKD